jgi:hypothetical protein
MGGEQQCATTLFHVPVTALLAMIRITGSLLANDKPGSKPDRHMLTFSGTVLKVRVHFTLEGRSRN